MWYYIKQYNIILYHMTQCCIMKSYYMISNTHGFKLVEYINIQICIICASLVKLCPVIIRHGQQRAPALKLEPVSKTITPSSIRNLWTRTSIKASRVYKYHMLHHTCKYDEVNMTLSPWAKRKCWILTKDNFTSQFWVH